ncbi:MAG: sodium/solute symporter [Planctomycetes bacterium]|nr:sodium/solute symporter [Planctomycetota bacterium]
MRCLPVLPIGASPQVSPTPSGVAGSHALGTFDVLVAAGYLLGIVAIGLLVGVRHRRRRGEASEYFLAGRSLSWRTIGLALFATNISTVHLVSLAQAGFDTGLLSGNFEWMAALTLVMLGLFFAPFYVRSGIATLPDFLERRYSRVCRDWLALVSVVTAVVIHIGFALLTGGIILEAILGIPMLISLGVLCVMTGLYTVVGGLLAVVITESIQTVVLLIGAAVITAAALWQLGGTAAAPGGLDGWANLHAVLAREGAVDKLSMLRPHGDPDGMPWYAVFLGYPVLGIWYWCADQTIVQRVLGARDETHARQGPIFAGLIKILPVFLFVLPGLLAFALFRDGRLDLGALQNADGAIDSKGVYASMITGLLPAGVRGLLVAALMAALMSTVSGALNSISTLVSYDLVKRFRPEFGDRQLVRVGRTAAGLALVAAVALVPVLDRFESVFSGINQLIGHVAPPITAVFVLGVFWRGASSRGAAVTLVGGSLLGAVVFAVGKLVPGSPLDRIPGGFMMVAFWLFVVCVLLQVVASRLLPDARSARVELVWERPWTPLRLAGRSRLGDPRLLSALLLLVMALLYSVFR